MPASEELVRDEKYIFSLQLQGFSVQLTFTFTHHMEIPQKTVDDFEPFVGQGGGGPKRILAASSNVSRLDFKKLLRPKMYYAKAGNTGKKGVSVKPYCLRPGHESKNAPTFVVDFEVRNVRMLSQDAGRSAGTKELSGKVSWPLPLSEDIGEAVLAMGKVMIEDAASCRPGQYFEWETKGGKLDEVPTDVANRALWWSSKDSLHKGMYKEGITAAGLEADPLKWSNEDHAAFCEAFDKRLTVDPRDPDVEEVAEGAKGYDDFKTAQKPTFKNAVSKREDGSMVVYVNAKNFKKGSPEMRTGRDGKESPREQTYFCEVREDGTRVRVSDPTDAVRSLQHHSGGADGYRSSRPFTVLVHRALFAWDHSWIGNTGINPTVVLEYMEYSVVEEETSFFDQLAGVIPRAPSVKRAAEPEAAPAADAPPAEETKAAADDEDDDE